MSGDARSNWSWNFDQYIFIYPIKKNLFTRNKLLFKLSFFTLLLFCFDLSVSKWHVNIALSEDFSVLKNNTCCKYLSKFIKYFELFLSFFFKMNKDSPIKNLYISRSWYQGGDRIDESRFHLPKYTIRFWSPAMMPIHFLFFWWGNLHQLPFRCALGKLSRTPIHLLYVLLCLCDSCDNRRVDNEHLVLSIIR